MKEGSVRMTLQDTHANPPSKHGQLPKRVRLKDIRKAVYKAMRENMSNILEALRPVIKVSHNCGIETKLDQDAFLLLATSPKGIRYWTVGLTVRRGR